MDFLTYMFLGYKAKTFSPSFYGLGDSSGELIGVIVGVKSSSLLE